MILERNSINQELSCPQDSLHSALSRFVSAVDTPPCEYNNMTATSCSLLNKYRNEMLEPLPIHSPSCFDTLRDVTPTLFEDNVLQQLLEPTPLSEETCSRLKEEAKSIPELNDEESLVLPEDADGPQLHDVVCSRAKLYYQMPGCQRFRHIIREAIPAYRQAATRLDKSSVIAATMDQAMYHPTLGCIRFWKYECHRKRWVKLGSDQIRDKVGHALREMIHETIRTQRTRSMIRSDVK
ncbi:hypothetical protein FisN_31Lh046 [Fistulifera solaris]|uniref:DUF6824 domain-containing protein n=1 Tax=Fistulifera solaris TaxID=1519565 RepID=A0A1Z5K6A7_FISSO|nr:hypothetical protein FisN_31Lh046 [Fistulifera solaris]|eukprot:GAX21759.1 hypothetical protein FisN_31Lh046 [Fistulifera solaris]